jgi:hypothetical protein
MSQNNGWQLTLSGELGTRTKALQKEDQSVVEIMEQIYKLGLYQLEYRRESNPKKAVQQKLMREVFKKAQSDPELCVKLGLGTRIAL